LLKQIHIQNEEQKEELLLRYAQNSSITSGKIFPVVINTFSTKSQSLIHVPEASHRIARSTLGDFHEY